MLINQPQTSSATTTRVTACIFQPWSAEKYVWQQFLITISFEFKYITTHINLSLSQMYVCRPGSRIGQMD
jgi:hypothetical protein